MSKSEFNDLIFIYKDSVMQFLKKKFRLSNEVLEDIVQDSFIKAFKFLENNDVTHYTYKTWFYKVAYNTALDYLRTQKNKKVVTETSFYDLSDGNDFLYSQADSNLEFSDKIVETIAQKQILIDIFERMKLSHPSIYQTFSVYLDVDDYKKASEVENIPIGTIKSRINRARRFIQENISEDDLLTLT